jgi:hypothetical protein
MSLPIVKDKIRIRCDKLIVATFEVIAVDNVSNTYTLRLLEVGRDDTTTLGEAVDARE